MLRRHGFKANRGLGFGADGALEGFGEGLVVEERPWVVELVVPGALEVADRGEKFFELGVADERDKGGSYAVGFWVTGGVVVAVHAAEEAGWLVDCCQAVSAVC